MHELWRPANGSDKYWVSNHGRVRGPRGKILKQSKLNGKYHAVTVDGRSQLIHHLVAKAFIGDRPKGYFCCHKDDDKSNNHIDNLYWGTPSENTADIQKNGKSNPAKGFQNGRCSLTLELIEQILAAKGTQYTVARKFNISITTVWRLRNGIHWSQCN